MAKIDQSLKAEQTKQNAKLKAAKNAAKANSNDAAAAANLDAAMKARGAATGSREKRQLQKSLKK